MEMQVAVELWIALKVRSSDFIQKSRSQQRLNEEEGEQGKSSRNYLIDLPSLSLF